MVMRLKEPERAGALFAGWQETIIWSCLQGLYPSWDAHNKGSVALAQKLGYHLDYEYPAFEVWSKLEEK